MCFYYAAVPADNQQPPTSPQGTTPLPYTFDFAGMKPTQYAGGTVKIADSRNFKVAKDIAVAEVTVEPGSMRELHVSVSGRSVLADPKSDSDVPVTAQWHPSDDEWTYFL